MLAAITASAPLTTEILTDGDRVIVCFWRKPDAQVLGAMMKLAVSDDVVERATAAHWLERVGGRDSLVQLLKMLADPDVRVRHSAARGVMDGWSASGWLATSSLTRCVAPEGTALAVAEAIETETWPGSTRRRPGPHAWRRSRPRLIR